MNFSFDAVLASFVLLFLAEVGDKTQLLLLALATRYRSALQVFLGAWLAEILMDGLAIYFGAALTNLIPLALLKALGGLLFLGLGVFTLWKVFRNGSGQVPKAFEAGNAFLAAFGTILVSELGDKSQMAAGLLAIQWGRPLEVLVGVALGLGLASALSIFLGKKLEGWLPRKQLKFLSGALFVLFGLLFMLG